MAKKIIIILGPSGSGKGTQAKILSKKLNIPHISTGDLVREAVEEGGKLGKKIGEIMNQGILISDELAFNLIEERVAKDDCQNGFILDGFPRTLEQVKLLEDFIKADKIIEIDIPEKELIKRLTNRRQCPQCGAIYNLYTAPKPREDELCAQCKIKLEQRDDDKEEAIKKRLAVYEQETEPVLRHYGDKAVKINGEQSIEKVAEDIGKVIT